MKYNKHIDNLFRVNNIQAKKDDRIRMHAGERVTEFEKKFLEDFKNTIEAKDFSQYPCLFSLKQKLAAKHGVEMDNVFISAGSDYSLAALFYTFVERGTSVVMPEARFPMYDVYLSQTGGDLLEIRYKKDGNTLTLDYENTPAATSEVRMVLVGNPNSPVGDSITMSNFAALEKYGCPIVIDQAYAEFGCTHIPIEKISDGYIFVNTFSKAFGAAGIRVGYTIASKEVIDKLNSYRMMFEISTISAKFAEYLLDHEHVMEEYVSGIIEEREKLKDIGISVLGGNWVHLDKKYAEKLKEYTFKSGCKLPHHSEEFIKIGIFPQLHSKLHMND